MRKNDGKLLLILAVQACRQFPCSYAP